jgi:hypothetical protein
MTTANLLKSLLIAALLASGAARAADSSSNIQVAMEDGKTRAEFKLAGRNCVLVDDQIRCQVAK